MLCSPFSNLLPSPTLKINELVKQRWQQGRPVHHLGFGESRFDVHPVLQEALQKNTHRKSYLEAQGLNSLRSVAAAYYGKRNGTPYSTEQVIIGPGSKSLIYAIQMVLDVDIFLPTPSWVSYAPQAEMLGKRVHWIPAHAKDGYHFDLAAFDEQLRKSNSSNQLLILNSPNNPTGQMLTPENLQQIADYCRLNRVIVLSDEIYSQVVHGQQIHTSISQFYPEGTVVVGGLSKHLSLGGWRIGVGLLPDNDFGSQLMKALVVVASEQWSSVSAPVQFAAIAAYSEDCSVEEYIKVCGDIHGVRSRYLAKSLSAMGVRTTKPDGGFYVTANFNDWRSNLKKVGVRNASELAGYLLDSYDIAALPGSVFGIESSELSLRLSSSYLDFEHDTDSARLLDVWSMRHTDEQFMAAEIHPNFNEAIAAFRAFIAHLDTKA
ncbi:MAG: pyridoxal phosphate-dependent aminotransferase [Pseudomonadales bacterium]